MNSGFYRSKSFPEYYGCAYNYYDNVEKAEDIEYVFYLKMEKLNSNFYNKDGT